MVDLTAHNTLALPSTAQAVFRYDHNDQLPELSAMASRHRHVVVLGGGSNVVLMPALDSLVIQVQTRGIRVLEEDSTSRLIEVAAGVSWHEWVSWCMARGWGGLENLALIPGTVGAAPVQNIGAYGVEISQRLHSLQAWDLVAGEMITFNPLSCQFAYRDSLFKRAPEGRWLIVSVRFQLDTSWQPVLNYPDLQRHAQLQALRDQRQLRPSHVFDAVCQIRRNKLPDPAHLPNAGSFFKNPVVGLQQYEKLRADWPGMPAFEQPDGRWKLAAGWLIEQAGWRGKTLGPVGMHARQALVLVNHGGADATDVLRLAQRVRDDVRNQFAVELEQEPLTVQ